MKIKPGLSTWLDTLRWGSSLCVVAGHVRQVVLLSPSRSADLGLAWRAFYFATGFGHQAVIVFFVLSGYLVGGSVLVEVWEGRFRWTAYLLKRLTRLYPALLAALLLDGLLDLGGLRWWNTSGIYTGELAPRMNVLAYNAAERLTWTNLIGNGLMLQTIHVPTFGTNGPLWSLCNEFWYYILFPLLVIPLKRAGGIGKRVLAAALCLALLAWLPWNITLYFVVWLLGVAIHLLGRSRLPLVVAAAALGAVLIWTRISQFEALDFLLGFVVAAFIWSLTDSAPLPGGWLHKHLADFSYSLYVAHFPAVVFLAAIWNELTGSGLNQAPTPLGLGPFFGILGAGVAWGYGVSRVSEAHTEGIRRIVGSWLGFRQPAGTQAEVCKVLQVAGPGETVRKE